MLAAAGLTKTMRPEESVPKIPSATELRIDSFCRFSSSRRLSCAERAMNWPIEAQTVSTVAIISGLPAAFARLKNSTTAMTWLPTRTGTPQPVTRPSVFAAVARRKLPSSRKSSIQHGLSAAQIWPGRSFPFFDYSSDAVAMELRAGRGPARTSPPGIGSDDRSDEP